AAKKTTVGGHSVLPPASIKDLADGTHIVKTDSSGNQSSLTVRNGKIVALHTQSKGGQPLKVKTFRMNNYRYATDDRVAATNVILFGYFDPSSSSYTFIAWPVSACGQEAVSA